MQALPWKYAALTWPPKVSPEVERGADAASYEAAAGIMQQGFEFSIPQVRPGNSKKTTADNPFLGIALGFFRQVLRDNSSRQPERLPRETIVPGKTQLTANPFLYQHSASKLSARPLVMLL